MVTWSLDAGFSDDFTLHVNWRVVREHDEVDVGPVRPQDDVGVVDDEPASILDGAARFDGGPFAFTGAGT